MAPRSARTAISHWQSVPSQVVCTDPYGDHLLVGHLLELNGLDLDRSHSEFGSIPLRRAGLVLVVNIAYHNTVPFSIFRPRGRRRIRRCPGLRRS